MTIMDIEKAVSELSSKDLQRFHAWFEEFFAQKWDKQIEADAKSGKLDKLISEATEAYEADLSKPL